MDFELKDINKELSDIDGRYYMINLTINITLGKIIFPTDLSIVYDAELKEIYDFYVCNSKEKSIINSLSYTSNNGTNIKLITCSNGFRHTSDFRDYYRMHKINVDVALQELINR